MLSGYLSNYFTLVSDHHSYTTRGSLTYVIPFRFKSSTGNNIFLYCSNSLQHLPSVFIATDNREGF